MLRRALDNAVALELSRSRPGEANEGLERFRTLRGRLAEDAFAVLRDWQNRAFDPVEGMDVTRLEGLLRIVDDRLAELPRLAGENPDDLRIATFVEAVTAIRREVLRQALERLESGSVLPGNEREPLWDHLTKSTNAIRFRVAARAEQFWRNCETGSHAVSRDMQAPDWGSREARDVVKPAADAILRWEGSITDEHPNTLAALIRAFRRGAAADRVDADGFIATCGSICPVINRLRDGLANPPNPEDPLPIGPREHRFLDRYLRLTAANLGELLTVLPPRDWITGTDPERRLNERVNEFRLVGNSPREGSAERELLDHPDRLTSLWDTVRRDALSRLSAETRGALATAFNDRNLTRELTDFVATRDDREAQQRAWRIASILSDFTGQLQAFKFDKRGWADELQIARMEEVLSAIGEAVMRKLGQ